MAASAQTEDNKHVVNIQPGMNKEQVTTMLGEPAKTVVFGPKTILTYSDMTVVLESDKVVEVNPK
jgi:SmpA / OmlA family